MARSHIRILKEAKADQIIEVKTRISHPMETGLRKTADGAPIPRKIINRFECIYLGQSVFVAELQPAVSADPYISFFVRARQSGKLEFVWTDDDGAAYRDEADLTVI
ncbi:thiosulfate oxidation carrier complex protein SoxZ [Methylocapsa aurea]|uniref:thiosulfate oxidation carrier complex protein SoxZ n=1 Tax=Methylocapsa aurea TaxID=663610 RepID=UPI00055D3690|nr:thiosulfate oxidation carrier complex protein SoxZ [Methylocapsa aurea]